MSFPCFCESRVFLVAWQPEPFFFELISQLSRENLVINAYQHIIVANKFMNERASFYAETISVGRANCEEHMCGEACHSAYQFVRCMSFT